MLLLAPLHSVFAANKVNLLDFITSGIGIESDPYSWADVAFAQAQTSLGTGGGTVFVTNGWYQFNNAIVIRDNVRLQGQSRDNAVLRLVRDGYQVMVTMGNNTHLETLTLDGNSGDTSSFATMGVKVFSATNVTVSGCRFRSINGAGTLIREDVSDFSVRDCVFVRSSYASWVENIHNTRNVTYSNCVFTGGNSTTIQWNNPFDTLPLDANFVVENCWFDEWGDFAIGLAHMSNVKIRNNTMLARGTNAYNSVIHIEDGTTDVLIENNNMANHGSDGQGIEIQGCDEEICQSRPPGQPVRRSRNIRVVHNWLHNASLSALTGFNADNVLVASNFFQSNYVHIDFWKNMSNLTVVGNWFMDLPARAADRSVVVAGNGTTNWNITVTNNIFAGEPAEGTIYTQISNLIAQPNWSYAAYRQSFGEHRKWRQIALRADQFNRTTPGLLMAGRNGLPNAQYSVRWTTNIALPVTNWIQGGSGVCDETGHFTYETPVDTGSRWQAPNL